MLLAAAAKAAREASENLKMPKARTTPDKDATAYFAYMLVAEFPPRRKSIRLWLKTPLERDGMRSGSPALSQPPCRSAALPNSSSRTGRD